MAEAATWGGPPGPQPAPSPVSIPDVFSEPRLAYDDEKSALLFLTRTFGFRELSRMENADHSLMAWLQFGHSSLMIGRSGSERHNLYSPRETGKPTAEVNVVVNDIDAHFAHAVSAGVEIGTPLVDAPWGQRHYEAVDPEGHGWHFMKPLEDVRSGKATPEGLELRLAYADEQAAINFLIRAFDFREHARINNPDGSFMAWLEFGSVRVGMICRADPSERLHSPKETGKPSAMLNLHVDQIDEHYQRAVSEGAKIVTQLEDAAWGYRRYEALDPEGHRWHIMKN